MIYYSVSIFLSLCLCSYVFYLEYKKYNSFKQAIHKNKNMIKFIGVGVFIYYLYMINYDYSNPDYYGSIKPLLFWIVCALIFLFVYLKDKFWSNKK